MGRGHWSAQGRAKPVSERQGSLTCVPGTLGLLGRQICRRKTGGYLWGWHGGLPGGGGIEVKQLKPLEWDFLVGGWISCATPVVAEGPRCGFCRELRVWGAVTGHLLGCMWLPRMPGGRPSSLGQTSRWAWGSGLVWVSRHLLWPWCGKVVVPGRGPWAQTLAPDCRQGVPPHPTTPHPSPISDLPFSSALTHHPHTLPRLPIPLC